MPARQDFDTQSDTLGLREMLLDIIADTQERVLPNATPYLLSKRYLVKDFSSG